MGKKMPVKVAELEDVVQEIAAMLLYQQDIPKQHKDDLIEIWDAYIKRKEIFDLRPRLEKKS